jgi:hypothetical protein
MIGVGVILAVAVLSSILAVWYVETLRVYRTHVDDVGTQQWRAAIGHRDGYVGRHRGS